MKQGTCMQRRTSSIAGNKTEHTTKVCQSATQAPLEYSRTLSSHPKTPARNARNWTKLDLWTDTLHIGTCLTRTCYVPCSSKASTRTQVPMCKVSVYADMSYLKMKEVFCWCDLLSHDTVAKALLRTASGFTQSLISSFKTNLARVLIKLEL